MYLTILVDELLSYRRASVNQLTAYLMCLSQCLGRVWLLIVSVGEQARADDEDVAPFVYGLTLGEYVLPPAGEEWYTLLVDEKHCEGDIYFSMASMPGGFHGVNTQ